MHPRAFLSPRFPGAFARAFGGLFRSFRRAFPARAFRDPDEVGQDRLVRGDHCHAHPPSPVTEVVLHVDKRSLVQAKRKSCNIYCTSNPNFQSSHVACGKLYSKANCLWLFSRLGKLCSFKVPFRWSLLPWMCLTECLSRWVMGCGS